MKNPIKFFEAKRSIATIRSIAIIALVVLAGFATLACPNPAKGEDEYILPGINNDIVGTWAHDNDNAYIMVFNGDGTYEITYSGILYEQGTYLTPSPTVCIVVPTHVGGQVLYSMGLGADPLEWYSVDEAKALDPTEAIVPAADIEVLFVSQAVTYSITGDVCTVNVGSGTESYTRQ